MRVTGWTHFDNDNYIDVADKATELRVKAIQDAPPIERPSDLEWSKMSEEQQIESLKEYKRKFAEYLNTPEINAAEKLLMDIKQTVIDDVRANGYHFFGEQHQGAIYGAPIVDDKYILRLSMRSWGDIIAKAFPEEVKDAEIGYRYTTWAWYNDELKDKVKTPSDDLIIRFVNEEDKLFKQMCEEDWCEYESQNKDDDYMDCQREYLDGTWCV